MYDWALTEVMPEDRPTSEVINSDAKFDAWLLQMERKMQKLTYERQKMEAKSRRH